MRERYDTWTVKGLRLEAGAIRRNAQRLMDEARELEQEADERELREREDELDEYPPGFDAQYDREVDA